MTMVGSVLYGADDLVTRWVSAKVSNYTPEPNAAAIGIVKDEKIVAGVIYERFNGFNVEATIAAAPKASWADRHALFHLFYYPFGTLGAEAVSVLVPQSNLASLNLATKLGFDPIAFVPFAAPDGSPLVVLQQYREKCRWLGYGKKRRGQRAREPGPL